MLVGDPHSIFHIILMLVGQTNVLNFLNSTEASWKIYYGFVFQNNYNLKWYCVSGSQNKILAAQDWKSEFYIHECNQAADTQ